MNRNVKLISILSLGLILGACGGNSSSQEEAIIVKTATASTYSNETVKEFPIITQPFRTTELSFRVSGPIDRLDVYAGNYYRRGDIIAEIDPRDYRIRRERAEAVYRQAKAEYERISALYQKNNLSASTYEKARAEYTSAKAVFDTAVKTKEEIIFCYPGLFAIFVYRIAHELYTQDVPFLPRIMTEYAHSRTGIDINSGAKIGEYFFIDHGTGVVIGETTEIGNNVKLYQGVTLGALSTRSGQKLKGKKRHPTIKDNVTVYSGASILGGETEIGEGVIVAGGAFVTKSVPAHTKVIVKNPEIKIKDSDKKIELQTTENKEGIWEI